MKKIVIVGAGIGGLTPEARSAIESADVLIGAPRLAEQCRLPGKTLTIAYAPQDVAQAVKETDANSIAILVSGDPGFYSAAQGIREALSDHSPKTIPGIGSVSAFFAELGLPWQDAALASLHGRSADVAGIVRRNRLSFFLLGDKNKFALDLEAADLSHVKLFVGEDLGLPSQKAYEAKVFELKELKVSALSVVAVENDHFEKRIQFGIPDRLFKRLDLVPMTKSEVRAVAMSKLWLKEDSKCLDVGSGTGSVAVEMGLACKKGSVCAIEKNPKALELARENLRAFHLGNVKLVLAEAPDAITFADSAFIGGTGGNLERIAARILELNPKARIVAAAISPETVSSALKTFESAKLEAEITQISIAKSKPIGSIHMMQAQNPVSLICAGGEPWDGC
jgi:precorrin-6Y C5,15-methyltransferase (decarboxylating)